jgi:hypothetical protein
MNHTYCDKSYISSAQWSTTGHEDCALVLEFVNYKKIVQLQG